MKSHSLSVIQLSKQFGGLQALDDVTLHLDIGERRTIIGPNGAGKTTLFNLICGSLVPSSGTVHLFGQDITRIPSYRRMRMGLARTFQTTNLFAQLSVLENLLLALQAHEPSKFFSLRPISSDAELQRRAKDLLEKWELADKADLKVSSLSYGDQRQLEIIMALSTSPKVLLLDEPTAGLSPAETARVVETIRNLDRETTVLLIEHDLDVAFGLADTISVLHLGSLLAEGNKDEIRNNSAIRDIYLGGSTGPDVKPT